MRLFHPNQLNDAQKEFGEQDHRAPITEEVEECGEIGTAGSPDSKRLETSYIQPHMYFDDSVESIEDGELQNMLFLPLYAQKASGKPDALVVHNILKPTEG